MIDLTADEQPITWRYLLADGAVVDVLSHYEQHAREAVRDSWCDGKTKAECEAFKILGTARIGDNARPAMHELA